MIPHWTRVTFSKKSPHACMGRRFKMFLQVTKHYFLHALFAIGKWLVVIFTYFKNVLLLLFFWKIITSHLSKILEIRLPCPPNALILMDLGLSLIKKGELSAGPISSRETAGYTLESLLITFFYCMDSNIFGHCVFGVVKYSSHGANEVVIVSWQSLLTKL